MLLRISPTEERRAARETGFGTATELPAAATANIGLDFANRSLEYARFLAGMRLFPTLRIGALTAAVCLCAQGQNTQGSEAQTEVKGMPPRATPADYQAQAQAGTMTVAAEFTGHSVPTLQGPLSSEDYVVIETALFGSPGARTTISSGDFSLRINGKKTPLPSRPYGLVVGSLKDPEWEPPEKAASKSKGSLSAGGKEQGDSHPEPVKIPIELQRAMAQRVQKASLPEGDRALPQAGLIFFQYRGKAQGIHSIELIYAGPAGTATLTLQP